MATTKKTLGETLREEAAARQRKEEQKRYSERLTQAMEVSAEADVKVKPILDGLEAEVKKAAKKGAMSLCVLKPGMRVFNEVEQSMSWKIDAWARKNGMHTHSDIDKGDPDWPWTQDCYVCWSQHREY